MQPDRLYDMAQNPATLHQTTTPFEASDGLEVLTQEHFNRLARLAQHLFAVPVVLLILEDKKGAKYLKFTQGATASELKIPLDNLFIQATGATNQHEMLVISDARLDSRFASDPLVTGTPHLRFYAGQVLHGADGRKLGTFCLMDNQPHSLFNEREIGSFHDLIVLLEHELAQIQEKRLEQHKLAEIQVIESEAKFRRLAETVPLGISIYRSGGYIYVNPAFIEITGYSADECRTLPFDALTHPEDRQMVDNLGRNQLDSKEASPRYQLRIITKSGEVRWIETSVNVIDFEGKRGLLGAALDITERKHTEEAQREQNEYLAALHETALAMMNRLDPTEL